VRTGKEVTVRRGGGGLEAQDPEQRQGTGCHVCYFLGFLWITTKAMWFCVVGS
jgi:hypothetical protein